VVFITIIGGSATAHAQRKMLVLIDASGSMSTVRADSTTRFEAAKARALDQIGVQAGGGLAGVAVYTFSDTTATLQTTTTASGFVDRNTAIATITGLDLFTVGGGNTPLAGSMCDAVNKLHGEPASDRILEVASDGEENFTLDTNECFGPFSTDPVAPYSAGSWQNKVYTKVAAATFQVLIDLFDPGPIVGFAARMQSLSNPEAMATMSARALAAAPGAAAEERPPTLQEFFTQIALVSGGRLTVIEDTSPTLPVVSDVSGDGCVDRSDAIQIARGFGMVAAPQDNPLDLDLDGRVGFSDYALALSRFTPGGCGTPDPYVTRAPIVCTGLQSVVIDGQAVEGGGITVDARGACVITIRNSLIVSGQNAIKILGSALIVVDNSIIVGENAFLASQGATVLSAAKTVFHGKRTIQGAFALIDRGGNTFE
jgi:hypothetical protein